MNNCLTRSNERITQARTHTGTHTRKRTHASAHTQTHTRKRTYANAHTQAHIRKRTHTHRRTHTRTHARTHGAWQLLCIQCRLILPIRITYFLPFAPLFFCGTINTLIFFSNFFYS